jgi:hypothetical protein
VASIPIGRTILFLSNSRLLLDGQTTRPEDGTNFPFTFRSFLFSDIIKLLIILGRDPIHALIRYVVGANKLLNIFDIGEEFEWLTFLSGLSGGLIVPTRNRWPSDRFGLSDKLFLVAWPRSQIIFILVPLMPAPFVCFLSGPHRRMVFWCGNMSSDLDSSLASPNPRNYLGMTLCAGHIPPQLIHSFPSFMKDDR